MSNDQRWYTKDEMLEAGLPYYVNEKKDWTDTRYGFAVLLSKSRCKEFGVPILENNREYPVAFRSVAALADHKHVYYPLYDRTSPFESGEISVDKLYPYEIMCSSDK